LRKRLGCHAMPRLFARITGEVHGVLSSTARKQRVTGMLTCRPVLPCFSLIHTPS
jgi:hypothetical protein